MSFTAGPVKVTGTFVPLIWLTATVLVLRGYVWPTLSNVEVAALQAMVDPSLFRHDFVVQEYLRFTPRFYWDQLVLLPVRAGLPLAWSFFLWHAVMLCLLLAALRAVAHELKLGAVAAAGLGTWALFGMGGTIGGVYFYTHAPVPAVWAGAVAAWGLVFLLRNRPDLGYAFFGIAVLLQFLVGFYAGVLAMPFLWRKSFRQWAGAISWWVLALALVYLPMRWSGGTGSGLLTNAEFVAIYARLRLPHHLVLSTWDWPTWVHFTLFYAGAALFLSRTRMVLRYERAVLITTIVLVAVLLGLNYLFVECWPIAVVAKLQPARITPLAQLVVLGLVATRVEAAAAQAAWLETALLMMIPLSLQAGFLFVLAGILLATKDSDVFTRRWPVYLLAVATALSFQPFGGTLARHLLHMGPWVAVFLVLLAPVWLSSRPAIFISLAIAALVGTSVCAMISSRPTWPQFLLDRFSVEARPHDGPASLGARFAKSSPVDAVVLVAPTNETWSFKLYARRSDVVDTKNTPFTDSGLLEWRRRMEDVLGSPLTPTLDPVSAWSRRSIPELLVLAGKYHAKYILTRDEWHPMLPGRRIDTDLGWSLWELP